MLRTVVGALVCTFAGVVAAEPATEISGGIVVPIGDTNENHEWPVGYKLAARRELSYGGKPLLLGAEYSTWDRGDPWRVHRVGVLAGRVWRSDRSHVGLALRWAAGLELVRSKYLEYSWVPNPDGEHPSYRVVEWGPGVPIEVAARAALRIGPIDLGVEAALVVTLRPPEQTSNDGPADTLGGSAAALDLSVTIRLRD